MSRLFSGGGSPIAVRVLMTDADGNGYVAVLQLSNVTRLIGRGDTTRPLRARSMIR